MQYNEKITRYIYHTSEYFEKANSLPNVIQVFIKTDEEKEIKEWVTYLINVNGEDVFRYIDKNNSDRFSFDQLKAKIVELRVL